MQIRAIFRAPFFHSIEFIKKEMVSGRVFFTINYSSECYQFRRYIVSRHIFYCVYTISNLITMRLRSSTPYTDLRIQLNSNTVFEQDPLMDRPLTVIKQSLRTSTLIADDIAHGHGTSINLGSCSF